MNQSQPNRRLPAVQADSSDCIDIFVDFPGDDAAPPRPLSPQEKLELRRTLDSYTIEPEKLAKVREVAQRLGRSKTELIREGLDLVLEKYRDQLGDLLAPEPPGDAPKPEDGSPSR